MPLVSCRANPERKPVGAKPAQYGAGLVGGTVDPPATDTIVAANAAATTGKDLDDPRNRVRAVQHARRTAHDLDPFDIVGGQRAKSIAPPGSLTDTPSTRTFTYLLSPPRRNSDVAPPYDPVCANVTPGIIWSAAAIDVAPRKRSSSPVMTSTVAGEDAALIGRSVAVTTTGAILVVSLCWAGERKRGREERPGEQMTS